MEGERRKNHWEQVYATKSPEQVSWTQDVPKASLDFIAACQLVKSAKIIDVGGGDSRLVDFLLEEGYEDITVLDISQKAIERAQQRLGKKASYVTWIVCDILDFKPTTGYDLWHDRAAFHFLTSPKHIESYRRLVEEYATKQLIIATFSEAGPLKCSGLEICQYSSSSMNKLFSESFQQIDFKEEAHITPFQTQQNFIFCRFERKK